MRINTVRIRGQVSQGIAFPISILPADCDLKVEENTDVTELLGVKKYEPPIPDYLVGTVKGPFPSFIPRTGETRVQVSQDVLDLFAGQQCYITEKLDGMSTTYYINDGEFGVCSRNLELLETECSLQWKTAKEMNIEQRLRTLGFNVAIQEKSCLNIL